MVFIPRRFAGSSLDATEEIRAPLALALAIVALVGWVLAAYLAAELIYARSQQGDALGRRGGTEIIQGCSSPL